MIRLTPAILAAALLLLGCNQPTDPIAREAPDKEPVSNTGHPEAPPSSDDHRPADKRDWKTELDAEQRQDQHIFQQVRKLKKGMTKQEVSDLIGDPGPSSRDEDEWYYSISPMSQWIDDGVQVKGYRIIFQDGRVKQWNPDSASYYFEPREGG